MNHEHLVNELEQNLVVFNGLFNAIEPQQYLWKAKNDKWCLLEVLCHLIDEEKKDFKARLKHVFHNSNKPFEPIKPEAWVPERNYIRQDYKMKLQEFLDERKKSITWLNSLENVNWTQGINHSTFGFMNGNMLLANWLAHDYLHIRQIIGIKYAYQAHINQQNLSYAGNW